MKKILPYRFINKPVKLLQEPNNPHDPFAVMVQIAGEKIGYTSHDENKLVNSILSDHDVEFIFSFISGGKYKVVSENGDVVKSDADISVKVRTGTNKKPPR